MVGLIPLVCPNCGASLQMPQGRTNIFCMYCGTNVYFDDGTRTYVYREVDETRVKELEVAERWEMMRVQRADELRPRRIRLTVILIASFVGLTTLGVALGELWEPASVLTLPGALALYAIAPVWLVGRPKKLKVLEPKTNSSRTKQGALTLAGGILTVIGGILSLGVAGILGAAKRR
ncbi:MAG: zinc ribbon domain-containing protein [Actinomycetaceae bacterium]|nr:zinc ribbon domain-containing protein [Actinomycetaceae bacterium]